MSLNVHQFIEDNNIKAYDFNDNWIQIMVKKHPELTFEDCVDVTSALFDDITPHMNAFCKNTNRLLDIQSAFEYGKLYNQKEVLESLFERHQYDELLIGWTEVYKLNELLDKDINAIELLDKVNHLYGKVNSPSLKIKLDMMKLYIYQGKLNYNSVLPIEDAIKGHLPKIHQSYFKSIMSSRTALFLAKTSLVTYGDVEQAERDSLAIVENPQSPNQFKAPAYQMIGSSFKLRNYEQSLTNYMKACETYRIVGLESIARNIETKDIPLLNNLHGKIFDVTDDIEDVEIAHQYMIRGEKKKAIDLLMEIAENKNINQFSHTLYSAILSEDLDKLISLLILSNNDMRNVHLVKHFINKNFNRRVM